MSDAEDLYKAGRTGLDVLGMGEAVSIASGVAKDVAPWVPGGGFTAGADKVLGPLGTAASAVDLASGGFNLAKGIDQGNDAATMTGVHDLLGGTAGMLGNVPGPVGAVAKAFSGGYALGDMIAPTVFGSEEEANKPHTEAVPEDGVFKPTTGNRVVDGALDLFGIRD